MKAWNTSPDPQTPRGVGTEHIERHAGLIAPAGEHFVWKSKLNLVNVFWKGVHPGKPSRGDQPQRWLGRLLWVALPWQHKVRLGLSHTIYSCDSQFWFSSGKFPVLIFTWDFVKLRFVSHDVPSAWRLFGQDLRISYKPFGKASVSGICESQQSFVDFLTTIIFTFRLFVCLSPWWHLHLSPSNDVLDHTNHIFSESLSSGDDNGRHEDLQKTKKKTHRHRQRQIQNDNFKEWIFFRGEYLPPVYS